MTATPYQLQQGLDKASRKWLRKQPAATQEAFKKRVKQIVQNPYANGQIHLRGAQRCSRRVYLGSDGRIIYTIDQSIVTLLRTGPRGGVYKE